MSKKKKPVQAPLSEQLAPLASGPEVVEPEPTLELEKEVIMTNTTAAPEVKPEVNAAPAPTPAPAEPVVMAAPVQTRSFLSMVKASLPFVGTAAAAGGIGYYVGRKGLPWKSN